MNVLKSNGEREIFDSEKLSLSLKHAGAAEQVRNTIVEHIKNELVDGMTTMEIYKHAHELLAKKQNSAAIKYSIRKAIQQLGPSGFPFEQLVAELYKREGYTVATDKYVQGKCVEHEVDVIAYRGEELIMMEAKFHNQEGVKTDLKVALYVKARFDDLRGSTFDYGEAHKLTRGILITNTKFTHTARNYSKCSGMELIGWNYPKHGNLQDTIEEQSLHPVTCLNSLSNKDKKTLVEKDIIFLRTLNINRSILGEIGMDKLKQQKVLKELRTILK
jgi:hypothetical protein